MVGELDGGWIKQMVGELDGGWIKQMVGGLEQRNLLSSLILGSL